MKLYLDTLSWFWANQLYCVISLAEKLQIPIL